MHDLPAVGKLPEDQREQSVWRFSIPHRQVPRAAHESGFRTKHLNPQIGKIEFPHFMLWAVIHRFVALERRLPSVILFRAGEKGQFGRMPVTGHEAVEVVVIPCILLSVKHLLDGSGCLNWRPVLRGCKEGCTQNHQ